MDWKLEVVIAPVSDVERAREFYVDKLGFTLDSEHQSGENFRVIQVTPPGSALLDRVRHRPRRRGRARARSRAASWSSTDIEEAHRQLEAAGVENTGPQHFAEGGVMTPGVEPNRADYGTFIYFDDPDGNTWAVQEIKQHAR